MRNNKPFQIGIYGKGGIGKSTITANLSACLGKLGQSVLQIGCDPKSDSTKLLLNGKKQVPILEVLKEKSVGELQVSDFMESGYEDVCCTEAGGPQAGVGCAGRGIITMVEVLKNKGIYEAGFDYIFYDILGDVVCGGFSVPLREGFADGIIIVTSGEFQSLYAANNICRGLGNLNGKLIGIIGNSRNINTEKELIKEFCRSVNTELLTFIPNSRLFWEAEVNRKTAIEYAPDSDIAGVFEELAFRIMERDFSLKIPEAMEDSDFEKLNLKYFRPDPPDKKACRGHSVGNGIKTSKKKDKIPEPGKKIKASDLLGKDPLSRIESKCLKNREPLHGCALSGAYGVTTQIKDYTTIMHSPPGCGYINSITNSGASLTEKIYGTVNQPSLFTRLIQTNIREKDVIFGGTDILKETVEKMVNIHGKKNLFIISACASAIIGDNPENIIKDADTGSNADITVMDTQGVVGGDYFQGMLDAYRIISEKYIDNGVKPEKDSCMVNLINEKTMLGDTEYNYYVIESILKQLGIDIHCRFIRDTTIDTIRNFRKAPITIPYDDGHISTTLSTYLYECFDIEIFKKIPAGFDETSGWIEELAGYFGKKKSTGRLIKKYRDKYESIVKEQRKVLEGKSLLIFSFNINLDYIIKTATDLGMKIMKVCFIRSVENDEMRLGGSIDVVYNFDEADRDRLIRQMKPDIVLTNIPVLETVEGIHYDLMPYYPRPGFFSGLELSKKWMDFFTMNFKEGWRDGEQLFNKLQFKS